MNICKMSREDVPAVALIEKECFSLPWSEKSFEDALAKEENIYLVAKENDTVIGYVGAWGVLGEADITNVCVHPEHRKKGVGEALISQLVELGEKDNIDTFFLEVRESNYAAIALYEKMGFKNIGTRKNFYERPVENAIVMGKAPYLK